MGKQIQVTFSIDAELRLIDHLASKFPHFGLIDSIYETNRDLSNGKRSDGSRTWVIVDMRTVSVISNAAIPYDHDGFVGRRIVGRGSSCIEWSRDLYHSGTIPSSGRLYINTNASPVSEEVVQKCGDSINKMYQSACRWIRKHGEKDSTYRIAKWTVA